VVDTARSISTQSNPNANAGRRWCAVGRSEVRPPAWSPLCRRSFSGPTDRLDSPFRPPFACSPIGVRAHCSAASTLTNQFSAQYHSVSRVFIIISCWPQETGRRKHMRNCILIGLKNSLCVPTALCLVIFI